MDIICLQGQLISVQRGRRHVDLLSDDPAASLQCACRSEDFYNALAGHSAVHVKYTCSLGLKRRTPDRVVFAAIQLQHTDLCAILNIQRRAVRDREAGRALCQFDAGTRNVCPILENTSKIIGDLSGTRIQSRSYAVKKKF